MDNKNKNKNPEQQLSSSKTEEEILEEQIQEYILTLNDREKSNGNST